MDLADVGVARSLCGIASTEFHCAGVDVEVRLYERNRRVFESGASTFCQGVINAFAEGLPRRVSLIIGGGARIETNLE